MLRVRRLHARLLHQGADPTIDDFDGHHPKRMIRARIGDGFSDVSMTVTAVNSVGFRAAVSAKTKT